VLLHQLLVEREMAFLRKARAARLEGIPGRGEGSLYFLARERGECGALVEEFTRNGGGDVEKRIANAKQDGGGHLLVEWARDGSQKQPEIFFLFFGLGLPK